MKNQEKNTNQTQKLNKLNEPTNRTESLKNIQSKSQFHDLQYFNLWNYQPDIQNIPCIIKENYDLFIEGKFIKPTSNKYFPIINPATEEILTHIAEATEEDINKSLQAAETAYEKYWSQLNPKQKSKYLYKISKIIQEKSKELAYLETLNTGKPIKETLNFDIPQTAKYFFYYAGWTDKIHYLLPNKKFHPKGPVIQIIPDSFSLLTVAQKIAPALAAGNTITLIPSQITPLTTLTLAEIIQEANLPEGVLNIIPTNHSILHTIKHLNTKKIFTYPQILATIIILDDILIDQAVEIAVKAIYLNYSSTINSKILIQESIHQEFIHKLKNRIKTLRISDPLDKNTDIGALTCLEKLEKIKHYIEMATKEGHQLYQKETELPSKGYWYPPSFFANIPTSSKIYKEKIYGPIIPITTFITPQEAIEKTHTTYHITSIWTNNQSKLLEMAKQIKSKIIWANSYGQFDPSLPNYEGGPHALLQYLEK